MTSSAPVLVTGGTGYLGRWIVHALREAGRPVRALARDPEAARRGAADPPGPGLEFVRGDVTDRASLDAACRGATGVIHAAATVSSWERDRTVFDRVNVDGLRSCVEAAVGAGTVAPGRPFVFVSSFFALGPTDGTTADEDAPAGAGRRFANDYERTKTLAEGEARALAARGLPVVTVYPGVLYGPGPLREANLVGALLVEAAAGRLRGLPGGGDRRWCFTPVEDAAAAVVRALERGRPGERFVLGGENATLREFFDLVAEHGGPVVPRRRIPYAALTALGAASEIVAGLGGPRPKVTRGPAAIFRHEWAYDSGRARRALGWSPRTLAVGVPALLASLRAEGRIP